MSEFKDFPKDFLRRSIDNVRSYTGEFEVTNIINNCLGLIIIPKEHLIDGLPEYFFDGHDTSYTIRRSNIKFESSSDYSLKNIVRHMRNGLAHGRIEQRTADGKIAGLRIFDQPTKDTPENFSLELTIDELIDFSIELSKYFLKD
ncbi:MAG: hypothetical protein HY707_12165 [Ignavibacteriae bacterium]|nr:hypothetical protein [Ignavibacteriota bacterium]